MIDFDNINALIADFNLSCPQCKNYNLKLIKTSQRQGIRVKIEIKCTCGYERSNWTLHEDCNFAFTFHLTSNGLSKSKVQGFFLSMEKFSEHGKIVKF